MLDIIKQIYNNFVNKDIQKAQYFQTKANRVISELLKYKIIPATKVILNDMGFDVGEAAFPMKRYTSEEKKKITDAIKAARNSL
jgi:dihydrodipicolinate synthase/N-acetylneuraminate lyase